MQRNPIKSIAVLRLSALGDVCLTVPLIRALQHHLSYVQIHWIISRSVYPLVEGLSNVGFIVMDKPKSIRDYWRCYQQFKPYHFDVLLAPQATLRSNLLCPLIRAKIKYGYDALHSRDGQRLFVNRTVAAKEEHLLDSFLRFAEPFGISNKILDWELPISTDDFQWAREQLKVFPGKWVAVCPAASNSERNWVADRYAELLNALHQRWLFNVVLVGGPNPTEKRLSDAIHTQLKMNCLNLVGKSSLKQLSALLGTVDALVSPDTGPVHIASAQRTPVVGLYAVASPEKTGPYFSRQWVVNKFPEAVHAFLNKNPSEISWRTRVHSPKAMALITVDDVKQKCDALFAELEFNAF